MGEAERRILDPRAPVIVTAKISRAHADELFGQRDTLSRLLMEASAVVCALMGKLKLEEITLTNDEMLEGGRLSRHMVRAPYLDGLKLSIVGQHEAQGDNGQAPPADEAKPE